MRASGFAFGGALSLFLINLRFFVSSTLPLLDDNQEAAEIAFLIELARANADDTAYLHPLPSKG